MFCNATRPPEGDFDLLFFVKMVSQIVGDHKLMQTCLNGERFDEGWEAIAEVLFQANSVNHTAEQNMLGETTEQALDSP